MLKQPAFPLAALLCVLLLAGCASRQTADREPNPDPFEPMNRVMFRFNDVADRYVAEPVARGYENATPRALRIGATNFFENLKYPITIVNQFLQGKAREGGADLGRFLVNCTIGLAGIFDPATEMGLKAHDEDFGQTLAVWGVSEGPFFMVPLFGPYTLTHGLGTLADNQVSLLSQYPDSSVRFRLWVWDRVQRRYRLLGTEEEIRRAYDPYLFVRDAYFQNRRYLILDGNIPDEELFPEDEFEDFEE